MFRLITARIPSSAVPEPQGVITDPVKRKTVSPPAAGFLPGRETAPDDPAAQNLIL